MDIMRWSIEGRERRVEGAYLFLVIGDHIVLPVDGDGVSQTEGFLRKKKGNRRKGRRNVQQNKIGAEHLDCSYRRVFEYFVWQVDAVGVSDDQGHMST